MKNKQLEIFVPFFIKDKRASKGASKAAERTFFISFICLMFSSSSPSKIHKKLLDLPECRNDEPFENSFVTDNFFAVVVLKSIYLSFLKHISRHILTT